MSSTMNDLRRERDERGATAVEYGLMVGLIAIVIIGAVMSFGAAVTDLFFVPAGVFDASVTVGHGAGREHRRHRLGPEGDRSPVAFSAFRVSRTGSAEPLAPERR